MPLGLLPCSEIKSFHQVNIRSAFTAATAAVSAAVIPRSNGTVPPFPSPVHCTWACATLRHLLPPHHLPLLLHPSSSPPPLLLPPPLLPSSPPPLLLLPSSSPPPVTLPPTASLKFPPPLHLKRFQRHCAALLLPSSSALQSLANAASTTATLPHCLHI